jgi:O-antigen/teichoic acid export membrane protein
LNKKEIRIQYSGFIFFAAKLMTVATGTIFTLLVARSLSQSEYGTWGILNIVVPYFTLLSTAIPFWTMRFVARDKEGATKTGLLANSSIAIIATFVYLALLPVIIPTFNLENYLMITTIAGAQIIEIYLIAVLEGCLQAQRPHFVGYGLLIGEISKASLAYVLIVRLQLSLLGVFLSIVVAFAIKTALYLKIVFNELRQRVVFSYIKEWLKGSAFNIYNIAGDRLAAAIFLMMSYYGREMAASYYQAAIPIANIITYSSVLAFALYPKLLAERNMDDATSSLKMVLMFAIPMTAGLLAVPSSFLIILSADYGVAAPLLMLLAVDALILTTSSIFASVIYGIERVDEKAEIPFRQVARSRLFIAFSLPYAHAAITLPTAYYVITNFANNQPLLIAEYAIAINTVAHFAMFVVMYFLVHQAVKLEIPWKSVLKYAFASVLMATILFVLHPTRALLTLAMTAVAGAAYLAVLLAIDGDARKLARDIIKEVKTIAKKIA